MNPNAALGEVRLARWIRERRAEMSPEGCGGGGGAGGGPTPDADQADAGRTAASAAGHRGGPAGTAADATDAASAGPPVRVVDATGGGAAGTAGPDASGYPELVRARLYGGEKPAEVRNGTAASAGGDGAADIAKEGSVVEPPAETAAKSGEPQTDSGGPVPLRAWLESESSRCDASPLSAPSAASFRRSLLRRLAVCYAASELLRRHSALVADAAAACGTDNWSVVADAGGEVRGAETRAPRRLRVRVSEPCFAGCGGGGGGGRYLGADFPREDGEARAAAAEGANGGSEVDVTRQLGMLFYRILTLMREEGGGKEDERQPETSEGGLVVPARDDGGEPQRKRRLSDKVRDSGGAMQIADVADQEDVPPGPDVPLAELGFPPAACQLVQNLLDCAAPGEEGGGSQSSESEGDAYSSLSEVCDDVHLMLLDPDRFLFGTAALGGGDGEGEPRLAFRRGKLYGREDEVAMMTDSFCRVSGGRSEAFFLSSFSGNGKTMLVQSVLAKVDAVGGYAISHSFDRHSGARPLAGLVSSFDDLCVLIRERRSDGERADAAGRLVTELDADLPALARVLPSLTGICPSVLGPRVDDGRVDIVADLNLSSVSFLIQRFVRAVSSASNPVMLCLDDLQYCGSGAVLSVVESVLTDERCCLLFVGCYRSNEVGDGHAVVSMMQGLMTSGTMTTKLSLEGLNVDSLNLMISDALCMVPRLTRPLTRIVADKTSGSPFFATEFLETLVNRSLLHHSESESRWLWDEERITSSNITDNVLFLLQVKIGRLHVTIKEALKTASCFGTRVHTSAIGYLAESGGHPSIRAGIEQARREGLMVMAPPSHYKFVHDKVQEACFNLIPANKKSQARYDLSLLLVPFLSSTDEGDIIFFVADQINQMISSTKATSALPSQMDIARINDLAGSKACDKSDFNSAYAYFSTAVESLPGGWEDHYDLTLRVRFQMARCAYSCGLLGKSYDMLTTIVDKGRRIEDKLESYNMITVILYDRQSMDEACGTSQKVLKLLGEDIPENLEKKDVIRIIETTAARIKDLSEESLLAMKEMDKMNQFKLKFYSILVKAAFGSRPGMIPFFTSRMVELTLQHGFCVHSIHALVTFSATYCVNNLVANVKEASKIGKMAIATLNKRFSSSPEVAQIYHVYFAFVSPFVDPLQFVMDNLARGFEAGITSGDTSNAFINIIQHTRLSLLAGVNLKNLLKRTEYYMKLTETHTSDYAMTHLSLYRDTIQLLIGNSEQDYSKVSDNALKYPAEATHFHRALRAFWIGHGERCHHFNEKLFQCNDRGGHLHRRFSMFIYGINSFKIIKRTSTQKLKAIPKQVLDLLKASAQHSTWNFRNKVHLIEAEMNSLEFRLNEAKASYAAAITSARCSRFVHEQGLACELAARHCKKQNDMASAHSFFTQAKQCYEEWGSDMKASKMDEEICKLSLQK